MMRIECHPSTEHQYVLQCASRTPPADDYFPFSHCTVLLYPSEPLDSDEA